MLDIVLGLIGIFVPAGLLVVVVRRWLDPLPWRVASLLMVLTLVFLGRVVVTAQSPLPLDAAAKGYPIRGVTGDVPVANANTSETARQILPWLAAVKNAYRAGRAPLWDRHSLSGHPLLGYGQAAPFSPFFVSTIYVPLPRQMLAMAGLKLYVGLLFGCLLLRREGLGWSVSVLGSMIVALSLFQIVFLYYPLSSVTALFPALLYSVSRLLDQPSSVSTILLALVTAGLLVSGHPESVLHAAMVAFGWMVLEAIAPRRQHHRDWRMLIKRAALAVSTGVLLSSPAWLPMLEHIPESARATEETGIDRSGHTPKLEFRAAALFLDPDHFGHPSRGTWLSKSNYAETASLYQGLVPIALLLAAIFSRRSGRRDRILVAGCTFCLIIAFDWTPIAHFINTIPPLSLTANARLRFVAILLAAIVSARFLNRLDRQDLPWLALSSTIVMIGWIAIGQQRVEETTSYLGPFALLGLWLAIGIHWTTRFRNLPVAAVAVPFVFLELASLNAAFHPPRNESLFAPELPIIEALRKHAVASGPFRVVGRDWTLLPDLATHYGLEDIRGVDPMASSAYLEVLDITAKRHPRWPSVRLIIKFPQPILDFLNVRYVLTDPDRRLPPRFEHLYSGPDGELFFNPRSVPRFFVPKFLLGRGDTGLVENLAEIGNVRRTVLVDSVEAGRKQLNPDAALSTVDDDGFGHFRLTTNGNAPTLIATSLPAIPGWRLRLNGSRASMERVNGTFVGFVVPVGTADVDLRYHPRSFDMGLLFFFIGLIALIVIPRATSTI